MPEQEQKRIQKKGGSGDDGAEDAGQVSASSKAAELKDEMDDILDEIDSVLEENAEEFVKSLRPEGRRSERRAPAAARDRRSAPIPSFADLARAHAS